MATYTGTSGDDIFTGTADADQMSGNGGDDTLSGGGGNDRLDGGEGHDTLLGGDGVDRLITDGIDILVDGGAGQDSVEFHGLVAGSATVSGGDGPIDSIYFEASFNSASSTASFAGFTGFEDATGMFLGTSGGDWLDLSTFVLADASFYRLEIYGNGGNDTIIDGAGYDFIYGGLGNDTIFGNGGDDMIESYGGDDILSGGAENDYLMGGSGDDTLDGGTDDDTIDGGTGNDVIRGGDGWDYLTGGTGMDTLIGGAGANFFYISGLEVVAGEVYDGSGSTSDTLEGGGDINLAGVTLIDIETLDTRYGAITMAAAQLEMFESVIADTVILTTAGSVALTGAGNSIGTIRLNAAGNTLDLDDTSGVFSVVGGAGDDTVIGGNEVFGGAGDDLLVGGGMMYGGAGRDTLIGGMWSDVFVINLASDLVAGESYDGGEGNDAISLDGFSDFDLSGLTLTSIEELTQTHPYGVSMDAALFDGLQHVSLSSITLTSAGSVSLEWGASGSVGTIDLNDAGNTLDFSATSWQFDYATINGGAGNDTVLGSSSGGGDGTVLNGNGGNDRLVGTLDSNETFDGGDGDDVLDSGGGGLADILRGGNGNDTLHGSSFDYLTGGTGNDLYIVGDSTITLTENAGGGIDEVRTTMASFVLAANFENLTGGSTTTYGQSLTGNALNNVIVAGWADDVEHGMWSDDTLNGGAGDDLLDGGAGADTLSGGAGNDVFLVDDAGDSVVELANKGTDEVRTGLASYALGANVENLRGTSAAGQTLTGNALVNAITGAAGDDVLDGGAGADTMAGGVGNDVYAVGDVGDVVTEEAGAGIDQVRTALAAYTLASEVENLLGTAATGQSLTGNALANGLVGGAGNDTLDGGQGADTMTGGTGDDIFVVDAAGDAVVEGAGQGTDQVMTVLAGYTLAANVEHLAYLGAGGFVGTGNNLANRLTGGAGDDMLNGLGGVDVLIGGAGRDRLDGGNGVDTADYSAAGAGVTVRLDRTAGQNTGGAGIDTLANVENLTGSAFDDALGGNASANTLDGGDGDDVLNGLAGNDTLRGGAGDDIFYVDAAGDKAVEGTDTGWDVVRANVDYVLGANLEELSLAGGARTGTGNALANTVFGSSGGDTLSGLAGDDILRGREGRDVLLGGEGADLLDGGAGKDTLTGGAARDVFQFRDGDFGTSRALADVISDFRQADKEKIALNLVDADTTTDGNQAFAWLGNGAFTGVAGQLHYAHQAGNTYVEGDLDGDGLADFAIALTGLVNLAASDFVL